MLNDKSFNIYYEMISTNKNQDGRILKTIQEKTKGLKINFMKFLFSNIREII